MDLRAHRGAHRGALGARVGDGDRGRRPPAGGVHSWLAAPVQVSMSSRAPVLPPGSVRHRPELVLTSSPLAWCAQFCAPVPLQGYHWTVVPLVVPALVTSRQPPWTRTVPSVYGDHCWPALPLQPARPIGLPSVSRLFWLAAQRPPAPVRARSRWRCRSGWSCRPARRPPRSRRSASPRTWSPRSGWWSPGCRRGSYRPWRGRR